MSPIPPNPLRRVRPIVAAAALALLLAGAGPARAVTLFGLVNTGELFASADGGATWTIRATLAARDAVALLAGATSSELLLASESGSIYRSTDAGTNWSAVSAVPASDVTALAGSQGTYLLLTTSGSVYRSADAGANWTGVGAITAPDVASAAHHGSAWFALARTGGVYRSSDDGATWTAVGAITTSEAVELASFGGKLYAMSASGDLYESADDGASFTAVSTISHVGTAALVATTTELVACLGTGEAAASANATSWTWRGTIDQLTVRSLATDIPTTTGVGSPGPLALAFAAPYPNPARDVVRLTLDLAREATVTVAVFDLAGREVGRPIARERLTPGRVTREWRPARLTPGVYTLIADAGGPTRSRRLVWLGRH